MSSNSTNSLIKIGVVVGKWYGGGVESVLMNYYRHINRKKIQFDFICDSDSTNIPYEEIESLGGRVILCPPYQKIFKYINELIKICKDNDYKIIHSNINALSVFPLFAAKKAGVPVRIAHSHSTSNKKEWKKTLLKNILRPFSKLYATDFFACTEHAGRWLFGNKAVKESKVVIINNGIELQKYMYNETIRNEIRKNLKYNKSDIVIGHVGRFMKQKNHDFVIDVFNELHIRNDNYKLLLLGQGPLEDDIKQKVHSLGLDDYVLFLGQKKDVNKYYQAMDLFLFPSLYEGLGMVMIEAQTSGLPCVASKEVPSIAKVSDKVSFVGLNDKMEIWLKIIDDFIKNRDRNIDLKKIKDAGFDIETEVKKLEEQYLSICRCDNNELK